MDLRVRNGAIYTSGKGIRAISERVRKEYRPVTSGVNRSTLYGSENRARQIDRSHTARCGTGYVNLYWPYTVWESENSWRSQESAERFAGVR